MPPASLSSRMPVLRAIAFFAFLSTSCQEPSASSEIAVTTGDAVEVDPKLLPGVVALCATADGEGCNCTGILISPDVVLTARHCRNASWALAGWPGWGDVPAFAAEVMFGGHCTAGRGAGDPVCSELFRVGDDLELVRLLTPVPSEHALPTRVASSQDISGATQAFVAGFGSDRLEMAEVHVGPDSGRYRPVTRCGETPSGAPTCALPCRLPGVGCDITENGDSGGPLFLLSPDGELVLAGVLSSGAGGWSYYERVEDTVHLIPVSQRPPARGVPADTSAAPMGWTSICEVTTSPGATPELYSLRHGDFTGDGLTDLSYRTPIGFFVASSAPTAGASLAEIPVDGRPLSDVDLLETVQGRFVPDRAALVGLNDTVLEVHQLVTEGVSWQWRASGHEPLDILEHDPFWGGKYRERCVSGCGPIITSGDFSGDGLDDIVVFGQMSMIFAENTGDGWASVAIPYPHSFAGLTQLGSAQLGDIAPDPLGAEEFIIRGDCGIQVYRFSDGNLYPLYAQICSSEEHVASDENGFADHGRWKFALGDFGGPGTCLDILIRGADQLHLLESNCSMSALALAPSTVGVHWQQPFFSGVFDGWGGGFRPDLLAPDLDGDGYDDVVAYGPHGIRGHVNSATYGGEWGEIGAINEYPFGAAVQAQGSRGASTAPESFRSGAFTAASGERGIVFDTTSNCWISVAL
mgnify:CR=1 FL=1